MEVKKPVRRFSAAALAGEDYAELGRIWPGTTQRNLSADLLEGVYTAAYLVVSVPLVLLGGLALAIAVYVRCAGVLLAE